MINDVTIFIITDWESNDDRRDEARKRLPFINFHRALCRPPHRRLDSVANPVGSFFHSHTNRLVPLFFSSNFYSMLNSSYCLLPTAVHHQYPLNVVFHTCDHDLHSVCSFPSATLDYEQVCPSKLSLEPFSSSLDAFRIRFSRRTSLIIS